MKLSRFLLFTLCLCLWNYADSQAVINGYVSECSETTGTCTSSSCKVFGVKNSGSSNCNKNKCPESACNYTVTGCDTSNSKCWGYTICTGTATTCLGLGAPCVQDGSSSNFKTCGYTSSCSDSSANSFISITGIIDIDEFETSEKLDLVKYMDGLSTGESTCALSTSSFSLQISFILIGPGDTYTWSMSLGVSIFFSDFGTSSASVYLVLMELELSVSALSVLGYTTNFESTETIEFCLDIERLDSGGNSFNNLTLSFEIRLVTWTTYRFWIFSLTSLSGSLLTGSEGSWVQASATITVTMSHTSTITATSTNTTSSSDDSETGLYGLLALLVLPFLCCLCLLAWLLSRGFRGVEQAVVYAPDRGQGYQPYNYGYNNGNAYGQGTPAGFY